MNTPARLLLVSIISLLAACSSTPSNDSTRYTKTRPASASETATVAQPKSPAPAVSAPAQAPAAVTPPPAPAPVTIAPVPPAAPAVATPPPPAAPAETVVVLPPPAPVLAPGTLHTKRTGSTVRVTWALPVSSSGYRAIEIMRNTQEQPSGRTRIRALRAAITEIEDTIPDTQANYWYWLKVTHNDGTIQNIGPVACPPRT